MREIDMREGICKEDVVLYEPSGRRATIPRRNGLKFGEVGGTGTQIWSGMISGEEYKAELTGYRGLVNYDRMRRSDAMIMASLMAVQLPIRQATWRVEAATDDNKDQVIAEHVSANLFGGMSTIWDDFLRQALLYLVFGWMSFEMVPKIDENKRMIWKKLAPRLPKTIYKWNVADDGGLISMTQYVKIGGAYEYRTIGIANLLLFTHQKEGDNYEGISLLRPIYMYWRYKMELLKTNAIFFDRCGAGIPKAKLPEKSTKPDEDKKIAVDLVKNLRVHEQAYVVEPYGFDINFMPMPNKKNIDVLPTVQLCDRAIMLNILAPHLAMGAEKHGGYALGKVFENGFFLFLQANIKYIENIVNRYCIKPLVDNNFLNVKEYPKLKAGRIETTPLLALSEALEKLMGAGMISPDAGLEDYIRETGGLPAKPKPKTQKAIEYRLKESGYWRELNEPEKCLNLREIDNRIERAKTQLADKIKGVLAEQIDQLARDVAVHPDTAKMKKQGKLTSLIKGELLDIYRYGRSQVKQELAKQKKHPIRLAEIPKIPKSQIAKLKPIRIDEDAIDFIDDKAYLVTRQMARRYENTALFAELEAKKLGLGKAATTSFITESLKALSDREAEQIAMHSVLEAFGIGRNVEAETRKEDIRTAYYSAIMDKNVCENCAPLDGKEHELDDPTYETPNPNCLGGNLCRCLTVYVMKSEALPSV